MLIIKKYANRRLYNTNTSQYINLDDLYNLVRDNQDFKVIDAKSEEDLTRQTLIQIIFEYESKNYNILPDEFLKTLIKLYNTPAADMFINYLKFITKNYQQNINNSQLHQYNKLIEDSANIYQNFFNNFFKGNNENKSK